MIDIKLISEIKGHFNITKNERIWLEAASSQLIASYQYPNYRKVRATTVGHTKTEFKPREINQNLVFNNDEVKIRFLGLLIIQPNHHFFEIGSKLILAIQSKLIEEYEETEFSLDELFEELSIHPELGFLSFSIFSDFFTMWNGLSSSGGTGLKLISPTIRIDRQDVIDFYIEFTDLSTSIKERFLRLIESPNKIKRQLNDRKQSESSFVDNTRLDELKQLNSSSFDLSKLIRLIEELDYAFVNANFYSTALLTRAVIDHVPPIFGCNNFNEVVANYKCEGNSRSFKKSMEHLNNSLRAIGDSSIHSQIRLKEVLPNAKQVDFSNDFDVLLAEIVRILK